MPVSLSLKTYMDKYKVISNGRCMQHEGRAHMPWLKASTSQGIATQSTHRQKRLYDNTTDNKESL